MKDDKYFDISPILEGKDLIMTMKQLPRADRIEFAADHLFRDGSWICDVAFSLANNCDTDIKTAVKLLRTSLKDARDAVKILDCLLKEVEENELQS